MYIKRHPHSRSGDRERKFEQGMTTFIIFLKIHRPTTTQGAYTGCAINIYSVGNVALFTKKTQICFKGGMPRGFDALD
jgi:hypothetical protein